MVRLISEQLLQTLYKMKYANSPENLTNRLYCDIYQYFVMTHCLDISCFRPVSKGFFPGRTFSFDKGIPLNTGFVSNTLWSFLSCFFFFFLDSFRAAKDFEKTRKFVYLTSKSYTLARLHTTYLYS